MEEAIINQKKQENQYKIKKSFSWGRVVLIFIFLMIWSFIFATWMFYGSLHPCGILQREATRTMEDTLSGYVITEIVETMTPAECTARLTTLLSKGRNVFKRVLENDVDRFTGDFILDF